jgi:multiple sugar transport system substrate-binding protein
MNKKRLLRIVLIFMLFTSFILSSCVKNDVDSKPTTDASQTSTQSWTSAPTPTSPPQPTSTPPPTTPIVCPNTELTQNSPEESIEIYSWNLNFGELFYRSYVIVQPEFKYKYFTNEGSTYTDKLDGMLASGDGAPDLFTLEAGFSNKYVNSADTLDITELGIDYAELYNQYPYTYELMTSESGQIKALTWEATPGVIYYNRTLAERYLGVSDPVDVQPYFADWNTFLATARQVAADSNGTVRVISGIDDIYRPFSQQRSQEWVVDGEIQIEQIMLELFDFGKILKDDELTFDTEQWTEPWTANKSNESVLAYFGPFWFAEYTMGFIYEDDGVTLKEDANPTNGDWACVAAPTPFFWGGTWIAASSYNNEKEISGDILRYLTINSDTMKSVLWSPDQQTGSSQNNYDRYFPNNIDLSISLASDNANGLAYLGGQNPYPLYIETALKIDVPKALPFENECDSIYLSIFEKYIDGEYASLIDAKQTFIDECNENGIGVE